MLLQIHFPLVQQTHTIQQVYICLVLHLLSNLLCLATWNPSVNLVNWLLVLNWGVMNTSSRREQWGVGSLVSEILLNLNEMSPVSTFPEKLHLLATPYLPTSNTSPLLFTPTANTHFNSPPPTPNIPFQPIPPQLSDSWIRDFLPPGLSKSSCWSFSLTGQRCHFTD